VPAAKYTQAQKDEALALYETHGPTAVEKQLGIPKGTVTRWAKETGVETVSVSTTRAGTEAASVYAKARRVELSKLLLEDAHRLREQLWQPARLVSFGGKDNTLNETTLDEPLFVDKKNILGAVGIAVDRVVKLDALDSSDDTSMTDSVVDRLVDGFTAIYRAGHE
jgi:hypothetical protein